MSDNNARIAELESRLERIAKAAMFGAECIDTVSYWNGKKQVSAYTKFDDHWMTQLTAEDMAYMRSVVGVQELEAAMKAGGAK